MVKMTPEKMVVVVIIIISIVSLIWWLTKQLKSTETGLVDPEIIPSEPPGPGPIPGFPEFWVIPVDNSADPQIWIQFNLPEPAHLSTFTGFIEIISLDWGPFPSKDVAWGYYVHKVGVGWVKVGDTYNIRHGVGLWGISATAGIDNVDKILVQIDKVWGRWLFDEDLRINLGEVEATIWR